MTTGYNPDERPGAHKPESGHPAGLTAPISNDQPETPFADRRPVPSYPYTGGPTRPSFPPPPLPPTMSPPGAGMVPAGAPIGPVPPGMSTPTGAAALPNAAVPPGLVTPSALVTPGRGRPGWPGLVAFPLVIVLAVVAGFQAYQINQLSDRLGATTHQLAEAQSGDGTRLDALEGRTDTLEEQAGKAFNPEAIASAVLPSVFRVKAGDFTGTAFAVGRPTADGGTNLFTNFHVVESVWEGGGRQVFLERTDQRFPATIVKVDKDNDVVQLTTNAKFDGLVTASTPVKSGQQIVVVGAPLGLEDTVTTGVVSAFREVDGAPGTMIQFDAPINPGNSGGPVINGAKEVVGIATAKARDAEGIGLAVPIKTACDEFKIC